MLAGKPIGRVRCVSPGFTCGRFMKSVPTGFGRPWFPTKLTTVHNRHRLSSHNANRENAALPRDFKGFEHAITRDCCVFLSSAAKFKRLGHGPDDNRNIVGRVWDEIPVKPAAWCAGRSLPVRPDCQAGPTGSGNYCEVAAQAPGGSEVGLPALPQTQRSRIEEPWARAANGGDQSWFGQKVQILRSNIGFRFRDRRQ
jgi:hypothetical protein